jgi:hypothetical protein
MPRSGLGKQTPANFVRKLRRGCDDNHKFNQKHAHPRLRAMTESRPMAHRNGTVPVMAPQNDSHVDSYYVDIAQKHWLKSTKLGNVKPNVIKDIWSHLEKDDFAYASVLALENLQILERYDSQYAMST